MHHMQAAASCVGKVGGKLDRFLLGVDRARGNVGTDARRPCGAGLRGKVADGWLVFGMHCHWHAEPGGVAHAGVQRVLI